jgi:hypothetical protein
MLRPGLARGDASAEGLPARLLALERGLGLARALNALLPTAAGERGEAEPPAEEAADAEESARASALGVEGLGEALGLPGARPRAPAGGLSPARGEAGTGGAQAVAAIPPLQRSC